MTPQDITFSLDLVDEAVALIQITTPVGAVELLGEVRVSNRTLYVDKAHVGGPGKGSLGRAGLNAVCKKILVEADVDEVRIQGGIRTTGCNPGRSPRLFRYPN